MEANEQAIDYLVERGRLERVTPRWATPPTWPPSCTADWPESSTRPKPVPAAPGPTRSWACTPKPPTSPAPRWPKRSPNARRPWKPAPPTCCAKQSPTAPRG